MKFIVSKKAKFRLRKLADHMRTLPRVAIAHFDMEHWLRHDGLHAIADPGADIEPDKLVDCGTSACALGWATTCPYFRRLGLRLVADFGNLAKVRLNDTKLDGHYVFEIIKELFDLDEDAAEYFFRDIKARTPKEWARNAERAIA